MSFAIATRATSCEITKPRSALRETRAGPSERIRSRRSSIAFLGQRLRTKNPDLDAPLLCVREADEKDPVVRSGREFSHVREVEILSDEEAFVRLRGGPDDIVWLPDESLISDGVDVVNRWR